MSSTPTQLPRFGSYVAVRKLGEGGMGTVWEARHEQLGKRVAVKVLLSELATDAETSTRFLREGQAAARIRHPHVVDVYDVGASEDGTYLVMELLEGTDLARLLSLEGPLSPSRTAGILLPVMSALSAAHAAGVVHRDLKPANIFVSMDAHGRPHPTVVDFGISKLLEGGKDAALTRSTAVFGTPYYLAPEQAQGSRFADARSDQYSLGVILYECLTGRLPFDGDSLYSLLLAIATAKVPPPSTFVPAIEPALDEIVMRAMSRDPAARFESVRELGRALLEHADSITRALWDNEFSRSGSAPSLASASAVPAATGRQEHLAHAETRPAFTTSLATPPPTSKRVPLAIGAAVAVAAAAAVITVVVVMRPAPPPVPDKTSGVAITSSTAPTAESSAAASVAPVAPSASESASASAPPSSAMPATTQTVAKKAPPRPTTTSGGVATSTPASTGGPVRGANSSWILR